MAETATDVALTVWPADQGAPIDGMPSGRSPEPLESPPSLM
jgi:hypothetical protein